MLSTFRTRALGLPIVVLFAAAVVVAFNVGRAGGASENDRLSSQLQDKVYGLSDRDEVIFADPETGVVCALSGVGDAAGSACTSSTASEPMMMMTSSQGEFVITVVSPTQELDRVELGYDGTEASVTKSSEDGTSVSVRSSVIPSVVTVLGAHSDALAVFHPAADNSRADES